MYNDVMNFLFKDENNILIFENKEDFHNVFDYINPKLIQYSQSLPYQWDSYLKNNLNVGVRIEEQKLCYSSETYYNKYIKYNKKNFIKDFKNNNTNDKLLGF